MSTTCWIQQNGNNMPKRKRAGLVCVVCHAKKIKCDLQSRDNTACSYCMTNGLECRIRASKRGNHRSSQLRQPPRESPPPVAQSRPAIADESLLCTPPLSTATREREQIDHPQSAIQAPTDEAYPRFAHSASVTSTQPEVVPGTDQSRPDRSRESTRSANLEPYLNGSGFLQVYSQEHRNYTNGEGVAPGGELLSQDFPDPDLLQSFSETYFRSCYAWCPVLDRETLASDLARSPLLLNALCLAGSHIQPPIIPSTNPATYYSRAKQMFYNDDEVDPITCLQTVCLFYWWSPRPSSQLQKDSAWWWTAVSIRQAQQMGLHREPKPSADVNRGLRRRIWWTLFARERITAICQGRPCLIDPEDCNIPPPTLADFPDPTDPKAEIFIYWVRLCGIVGRVAKYRSRAADVSSLPFPAHLAEELIGWADSLPPHLKLPVEANRTTNFDRDVHQLHLLYLAVIIVLHLNPSSQPLPRAYVPAVMAASCIARIFKDYLARGGIRFLMSVSGWICGIATLALLRASRLERLTLHAEEDIKILVIALKELRVSYPVADMFLQGFERLRAESGPNPVSDDDYYTDASDPSVTINNGIDWMRYFPFITAQTSGLANALLTKHNGSPFLDEAWLGMMPLQLQEPLGLFETFPVDMSIL